MATNTRNRNRNTTPTAVTPEATPDTELPIPAEAPEATPAEAPAAAEAEQPTLPGIVWEEPPARRTSRKSELQELADGLRANPGRWANMGERSTSVAYNIRKGQGAWAPAGSFETTTRAVTKTRANIYVRYIGTTDAERAKTRAANPSKA